MPSLGQTSPREARQQSETVLRDIASGQVIARAAHVSSRPWGSEIWACNAIAWHFDVSEDAVCCEDTDDGRFYSINGKPAAYIEGEYEPLFQLLQAAE